MKPSELLRQKGWCQGQSALSQEGIVVDATDPRAVRFCAFGAIEKSLGAVNTDDERVGSLYADIAGSLVDWNDKKGRTAEEVIAKLEEFGL